MFYKLIEKKPVKRATGQEWAEWYEAAAQSGERVIARDEIDGGVIISTIFTGIDQGSGDSVDPPQLFETMMFLHGKSTGVAIRSETWQQAENQHRQMARTMRRRGVVCRSRGEWSFLLLTQIRIANSRQRGQSQLHEAPHLGNLGSKRAGLAAMTCREFQTN